MEDEDSFQPFIVRSSELEHGMTVTVGFMTRVKDPQNYWDVQSVTLLLSRMVQCLSLKTERYTERPKGKPKTKKKKKKFKKQRKSFFLFCVISPFKFIDVQSLMSLPALSGWHLVALFSHFCFWFWFVFPICFLA